MLFILPIVGTARYKLHAQIGLVYHNQSLHYEFVLFFQIVTSVFNANEPLSFHTSDLSHLSSDQAKLTIDEDITAAIQSGTISIVVQSLEALQPEAAMMFHAFCDNIEAPYKTAVFIFTVQVCKLL